MKIPHKGELSVTILSVVAAVGGNYAIDKFFPNLAELQDYAYAVATGILFSLIVFVIYNIIKK